MLIFGTGLVLFALMFGIVLALCIYWAIKWVVSLVTGA